MKKMKARQEWVPIPKKENEDTDTKLDLRDTNPEKEETNPEKEEKASVGNRERLPPTFAEFPHLVIDVTQNFNKDLFSS